MPDKIDVLAEMDQALDRAIDRIRTLEAQRDELLATLEAVCAAPGKDVTAWQRAEAAIRKAKGEA